MLLSQSERLFCLFLSFLLSLNSPRSLQMGLLFQRKVDMETVYVTNMVDLAELVDLLHYCVYGLVIVIVLLILRGV